MLHNQKHWAGTYEVEIDSDKYQFAADMAPLSGVFAQNYAWYAFISNLFICRMLLNIIFQC